MGYSTSPVTLDRLRPQLSHLEAGEACRWQTEPGRANHFAYKIREALNIAKLRPREYPALAQAADRFRIELLGPSEVQAVPALNSPKATVQVSSVVTHGLEEPGHATGVIGATTADEIRHAWQAHEPSNTPLNFLGAVLPPEELLALYSWAESLHLLLFISDSGGLTIQRYSRDLAGLEWTPADLEETP